MNARSALFDLWGDHLRGQDGSAPVVAPVAALVRVLAALDISEPAVRTAVSRMVRQGWLVSAATSDGPGYALTERARARLDDAARRIYRTPEAQHWDGHWHVVVVPHLQQRAARERVRDALGFLGYGQLRGDTWIAPRRSPDLAATLSGEGVRADGFDAVPDVDGADPADLAHTVWDLNRLAGDYESWQRQAEEWVSAAGADAGDQGQFAARSRLVHEWRKFLFTDPALPPELLPPDWPGLRAAALFDRESARLAPAATRFVQTCLRPNGDRS